MLVLTLVIGGVLAVFAPAWPVLSLPWWVGHVLVLAVVVTVVFFAAPALARLARLLAGVAPRVGLPARASVPVLVVTFLVSGVVVLLLASGGVADPLVSRVVLGVPFTPAFGVVWLAVVTRWCVRLGTTGPKPSSSGGV